MANPTVLGLLYAYKLFLHRGTSENWVKFNDPFSFTLKTNSAKVFQIGEHRWKCFIFRKTKWLTLICEIQDLKSLQREKHTSPWTPWMKCKGGWREREGKMLKSSLCGKTPVPDRAELQQVLQMTLYINMQCPHHPEQPGHWAKMAARAVHCRLMYGLSVGAVFLECVCVLEHDYVSLFGLH